MLNVYPFREPVTPVNLKIKNILNLQTQSLLHIFVQNAKITEIISKLYHICDHPLILIDG